MNTPTKPTDSLTRVREICARGIAKTSGKSEAQADMEIRHTLAPELALKDRPRRNLNTLVLRYQNLFQRLDEVDRMPDRDEQEKALAEIVAEEEALCEQATVEERETAMARAMR